MKRVRWTYHALQAIDDRDIDRAEVEKTIVVPEHSDIGPPRRSVLMRTFFDTRLKRQMLLRVVVEDTLDELVVVTVYKTSRIAKYLSKALP